LRAIAASFIAFSRAATAGSTHGQHVGELPRSFSSASTAERMFGGGMSASMAQSGTIFMSP